jgi:hypothetical protein
MNTKCKSTSDIKSGDLLIWTGDNTGGKSDFYLKLVRFFTMSDYGHVSTAWKIGETLYHVEATQPEISLSRVRFDETFFHIPMCLGIENTHMQEKLSSMELIYKTSTPPIYAITLASSYRKITFSKAVF